MYDYIINHIKIKTYEAFIAPGENVGIVAAFIKTLLHKYVIGKMLKLFTKRILIKRRNIIMVLFQHLLIK